MLGFRHPEEQVFLGDFFKEELALLDGENRVFMWVFQSAIRNP